MGTQQSTILLAHHLRGRMGRVCVAITGKTPQQMLDNAEEIFRENPFLEFRLDLLDKSYFDKPQSIFNKLKAFLEERPLITAIATCRRKPNGGEFPGSIAQEMELLAAAGNAGCHIVDVEIETAEALKHGVLGSLRDTGAAILVSFHDFQGTPDLEAVYGRMKKLDCDFHKVVPTAKSLGDSLKLLRFLQAHAEDATLTGMSMGPFGIPSRLLAPRFGSLFTFASATVGEETAPGQIAARTMAELYRIDSIEASTRVYGVAGSPIGHSLSPLMINTGFRRETVNAVYMALECKDVKDLLKLIDSLPVSGVSITMPLKEQVMPLLEKSDPLSAKIGACNTIIRAQDGKLYGFNTDVGGIVGPLERRLPLRGAKVLVLGAGGAARAAVFGLKDKGCDVSILNRTPEKAQKLAKQSGARAIKRDLAAKTRFDVIINATSYGMGGGSGGDKNAKIAAPLTADEMNCGLFFELVYNPIETPLIRIARSKGIPVILGIEMFVQQGARQFEIWTGKPAPQDEMLRVVLHALRQQAGNALPPEPVTPPAVIRPVAAVPKPVAAPPPAPKAEAKQPAPTPKAPVKAVAVKKASPAPAKKAALKKPAPKPAPKPVAKSATKKTAVKQPVKKIAAKAIPARKIVAKKPAPKPVKKTAPAKKPAPKKPQPKKVAAKKKR